MTPTVSNSVTMPSLKEIKVANAACSLLGKRALVVGGTNGIGMGIALRLAKAQASVTIVGRNEQRGQEVLEQMKRQSASDDKANESLGDSPPQFSFIKCDASLVKNIKAFSEDYKSNNDILDILVLTQGIASMQGYTPTSEGIEQKLAIHYYGRVACVMCLLPLLNASSDPRVMTVLSAGVHSPYLSYKSDMDLEHNFSIKNGADSAGMYNDIFVDKMAKENSNISFFHTAPGFVRSNWGSELAWYLRGPIRLMQATMATSVEDCAEYHFKSLVSDDYKGGGAFYMNPKGSRTTVTSLHDEAADFVWNHTQEKLKVLMEAQ